MLENPVLSGIYRSAAAVALAGSPKQPNGRIRPSRARIFSRTRRRGIAIIGAVPLAGRHQMVKFTVKELPIGSVGIDVALPVGSFMMIPFGARDSFGLTLLTLIALNVVEP